MTFNPIPDSQSESQSPLSSQLRSDPSIGRDTVPSTPPPAYSLPGRPPTFMPSSINHHDPFTDNDGYDEDTSEPLSGIALSIAIPVSVKGKNNKVHIDQSATSSRIAMSVVRALREASMSAWGIPIIDEEGRPRPIEVKVDASISIEGEMNVVDDRSLVSGPVPVPIPPRAMAMFMAQRNAAAAAVRASANFPKGHETYEYGPGLRSSAFSTMNGSANQRLVHEDTLIPGGLAQPRGPSRRVRASSEPRQLGRRFSPY